MLYVCIHLIGMLYVCIYLILVCCRMSHNQSINFVYVFDALEVVCPDVGSLKGHALLLL